MEGGERCVFSSWKYSHYFELLKKKLKKKQAGAENLSLLCNSLQTYKQIKLKGISFFLDIFIH